MASSNPRNRSWLLQHLDSQQQAMVECLETLVNIDSGSHDPAGINQVAETIQQWLEAQGIRCRLIESAGGAHGLYASIGHSDQPKIFLTGHMDTVFPKGTVAQRPFRLSGNQAFGPGVADMKSGLVMNMFVLAAIHRAIQEQHISVNDVSVAILFTPDEEIGSPHGHGMIQQWLPDARAVFNAEPGRISGNVVTSRKGGDSFEITVTGRAAHAGVSHQDGISAIEAMARIIQRIHQLTDYQAGITTNIGTMRGGTVSNTVADYAEARLDVRYKAAQQRQQLHAQLEHVVQNHQLPGAQANLTHLAGFLPFEEVMSEPLLTLYQRHADRLGFKVAGEFTGGCSDAGSISAMGIPTLCATGPVGAYMHTDREFCDVSTFVPRAQAVAGCILELSELAR